MGCRPHNRGYAGSQGEALVDAQSDMAFSALDDNITSRYGLVPEEDLPFINELIEGTSAVDAAKMDNANSWPRARFL